MHSQTQVSPLLEVRNLSVSFTRYGGGFKRKKMCVIRDLHVEIHPGEIVAVVGASGSGKSLLAHALLGILPGNASASGQMVYDGKPLTPHLIRKLRGREIALVPQSVQFLDPLMRVGEQVRSAVRQGDAAEEQRKAFQRYRLEAKTARKYPFQLSGGMARRVLVSIAAVSGARLLIADEPTPGLDPAVVHETLRFFREQADRGCAVMLITHDIEAALKVADTVAVFYEGSTVEIAAADDFNGKGEQLRHPYTKALWRALPQNDFVPAEEQSGQFEAAEGRCAFINYCRNATATCGGPLPELRALRGGWVRCVHAT
ncbi:ATP-binding cassette domain-containing protein [Paenibacillus tarimensis]